MLEILLSAVGGALIYVLLEHWLLTRQQTGKSAILSAFRKR